MTIVSCGVVSLGTMKNLTGSAVFAAAVFALTACGSSLRVVTDKAPAQQLTRLPAPLVKLIHSISKDRGVSGKHVVVYGPGSRYLLVKASSGDLVQKTARERKGFYLVVVHGHFVGFSHPAGTKAPRGTIETQVWSATEGVTDTGISDRLPAAVSGSTRSRWSPWPLPFPDRLERGSPRPWSARAASSSTGARGAPQPFLGWCRAGDPLGLRFAVRNISAHPVKVPLGGRNPLADRAGSGPHDLRHESPPSRRGRPDCLPDHDSARNDENRVFCRQVPSSALARAAPGLTRL